MDSSLSPPPREGPPLAGRPLEQWLNEARDGSPSALGRALEASRKHLLLIANRALDDKLKAKAGASDLVQDTFLDAQRGFGHFRGTTEEEFYGWLMSILANRLTNNIRHYRRTQQRDINREQPLDSVEAVLGRLHSTAATPGTAFLAEDEQGRVRLALERMREPWRSVLIERTWQGMAFAEIGARRNCTAEAARKLWARAVRQMRILLAEIE